MSMTPRERYDAPPSHEGTGATHYIHFEWLDEWAEEKWEEISTLGRKQIFVRPSPQNTIAEDISRLQPSEELVVLPNSDFIIFNKRCTPMYSDLPAADPNIIANLPHRTLVVVESERVGPEGEYHYVEIVGTDSSINGRKGYVHFRHIKKLPDTPPSLATVFNCTNNLDKNREFCSISVPQWYNTTEPYLDTFECLYKVNVVTDYKDTGGERALEARKNEQIRKGVTELLEYYDKVRTPEEIDRLLNAFKFAQAPAWNLDVTTPNSRLKVLVTVPAKYFDALDQAEVDVDAINEKVARTFILESSTFESDLQKLIDKMRSWSRQNSWKKSSSTYSGPDLENVKYGMYSFVKEANKLEAFLSLFKRFLALNSKSIRTRSNDIITFGLSDENEIMYIEISDDMGKTDLTIGLSRLKREHPFNDKRTVDYIRNLFTISNEFKTYNGIKGGWLNFLKTKKYNLYNPWASPNSKKKRCKTTLKDPYKCMPKEFKDFAKQHLNDIKCEDLPPELKSTPLGLAASEIDFVYRSYETGLWKGYEDRFATAKKEATAMFAWEDMEKFKEELGEQSRAFNGSFNFVGDPFVENLDKNLERFRTTEFYEDFGVQVFNKFMQDVVVKIDIRDLISKLHECICSQQRRQIQILTERFGSDTHPAVKAAEASAAASGCASPCEVLPILCQCLPIPWPLKFSIPKFTIPGLLKYLTAALIDAMISAIFKFLLDLIRGFISASLDCDRKSRNSNVFQNRFERIHPFSSDSFFEEEIAEAFIRNNIPLETVNTEQLNSLISDTVLLLTPREFCELISGNPSLSTLESVNFLIRERYNELSEVFYNHERITILYESIGDMIDPEICRNIDELLDAIPVEPSNYICDETTVREDIESGRATRDQINEMLIEASKCNADKLDSITSFVNKLNSGNDVLSSVMPEIFQTPANPNGIIPRDPPPIKFISDLANQSIFSSAERKFYAEMNNNVTTLVTTEKIKTPFNDLPSSLKFFARDGRVPDDDENGDLYTKESRTIANGLGTFLNEKFKDHNSLGGDGGPLVVLDVPPRNIYKRNEAQGSFSFGESFYSNFLVPGMSSNLIDDSDLLRTEKITIKYGICQEAASSVDFSRVRDAYSFKVTGENIYPDDPVLGVDRLAAGNIEGTGSLEDLTDNDFDKNWGDLPDPSENYGEYDIVHFDNKKKIDDSVLTAFEDFRTSGNAPPPKELFNSILIDQLLKLPWPFQGPQRNIIRSPNAISRFHTEEGFDYITHNIISRLGKLFSKSRLLDAGPVDFLRNGGEGTTFKEAFDRLKSIDFSPNLSCKPRLPGILNMDEILTGVNRLYENDLEMDTTKRYINSAKYGVFMMTTRVFCIHVVLNSVFAFSQFRAQDIFKSELFLRYLVDKFKSELQSGTFTSYSSFYSELKHIIGVDLAKRKYIDNEQFTDPFTGQELNVKLDPSFIQFLVAGTQFLPSFAVEKLDLEQITEEEKLLVLENPKLNCTEVVEYDFQGLEGKECVPLSEEEFMNEVTTGFPNTRPHESVDKTELDNRRTIGFLEFFFKEQLKSISGEVEVMLGTEINDINQSMVNGISREFDLPSYVNNTFEGFSETPKNRFFQRSDINLQQLISNSSEDGDPSTYGYLEIYQAAFDAGAVVESDRFIDGYSIYFRSDVYKERLTSLYGQGRLTSDQFETFRDIFESPNSVLYTSYNDKVGENLLADYQDLQRFLTPLFEEIMKEVGSNVVALLKSGEAEDQSNYFKPEAAYLQYGGFITENYITVEDKTPEDWEGLIDAQERYFQGLQDSSKLTDVRTILEIVRDKILNRPDILKGYVSLADWEAFLSITYRESLADIQRARPLYYFRGAPKLDTLTEYLDKSLGQPDLFFKAWKYGKRMSYVYPLQGTSPSGRLNTADFFNGLGETEGVLREAIKKKSFILKEKISLDFAVSETNTIDYEGEVNIFAVPLFESEQPAVIDPDGRYTIRANSFYGGERTETSLRQNFYQSYSSALSRDLIEEDTYKALFQYIFPLERFVSILSIYISEYVEGLPNRPELFDETKTLLLNILKNLNKTMQEDWYNKEEDDKPKWWERNDYELTVPGILFATPWKILEALLTIVNPLNWILGGIRKLLPDLPPYKSKNKNSCPPDTRER